MADEENSKGKQADMSADIIKFEKKECKGNPQLEDGYIRIANELWDAMTKFGFPRRERQVLDLIIRQTYGYNRIWAIIPIPMFVEKTRVTRNNVYRAIEYLKKSKIILIKPVNFTDVCLVSEIVFLRNETNYLTANTRSLRSYCINKRYKEWEDEKVCFRPKKFDSETRQSTSQKRDKVCLRNDSNTLLKDNNKDNIKDNSLTTLSCKQDETPKNGQTFFENMPPQEPQKPPSEKPKKSNPDLCKKVIDYLNAKLDSRYKHTTKVTKGLIEARRQEGFEFEDFTKVIDNMTEKWSIDPKMCNYLRPQTLFGTKFESYLNLRSTYPDILVSEDKKRQLRNAYSAQKFVDHMKARDENEQK